MNNYMNDAKVLIFVPVFPHLPPDTLRSLQHQTYRGEADIFLSLYDPLPSTSNNLGANLSYKQMKAKQIMLDSDYTHLLIVESDVIPPFDALENLMQIIYPVRCGWYRLNHGELAGRTSIIQHDSGGRAVCLEPEKDFVQGEIVSLDICILGCTLIDKWVLEGFNFDIGVDASFSVYCKENHIEMVCDTGMECRHLNLREHKE